MANQQSRRGPGLMMAIAGGVGFLAFVLLMALLGLSVSPAILLGVIVAVAVCLFVLRSGGDTRAAAPVAAAATEAQSDRGWTTPRQHETDAAPAGVAQAASPDGAGPVGTPPETADSAAPHAEADKGDAEAVEGDAAAGSGDVRPDGDPDAGATEAAADHRPDRPVVKPSKPLAGQVDLAGRKGSWKYERGGLPAGAATGAGAGGRAAAMGVRDAASGESGTRDAPEAGLTGEADGRMPPPAEAEIDHDAIPANGRTTIGGDPVVGTEPVRLDAPRAGGADDLKMIKGVGPALEETLNRMGFYHYDQIAGWSDREVAWVDANLDGFRGRVTRDDWVAQARTLADGGETEFSKRAEY